MKTITINGKDYNCVLKTKTCIQLEKKLGTNPLNELVRMSADINENKVPDMEKVLLFFHYCLIDMNHGITLDNVYDIFDEYRTECKDVMVSPILNLLNFVVEVFVDSGFISEPDEPKKETKGKNK